MRRRRLLGFLASAVGTSPFSVVAQQKTPQVIGILANASADAISPGVQSFLAGLAEAGYVEGRNVKIEYRSAEGHNDRLPALAADLVMRNVDLIATQGGNPEAKAAKNATSSIPIVFTASDPVADGLVNSLSHPGGNLTGIATFQAELMPKRLELLTELVPHARLIGILVNPARSDRGRIVAEVESAARAKRLRVTILEAASEAEIDTTFSTLVEQHADALVVAGDVLFFVYYRRLLELAARARLPVMYHSRDVVAHGGLISYGPSFPAIYKQAGLYAGRILNGEKPADLPVVQPTKFEFTVNLKTARELGLTVPSLLLAQADEVVE